MVAMKHHLACRSHKLDDCVPPPGKKLTGMDNKPGKLLRRGPMPPQWGLDLETTLAAPVEAELFS